jgi:hypothetical protein
MIPDWRFVTAWNITLAMHLPFTFVMRQSILRIGFALFFATAIFSFAQTAKDDMKTAGKDVKEAGKDTGAAAKNTGKATAKTAKTAGKKVKRGTNKAASKVEEKTRDKQ